MSRKLLLAGNWKMNLGLTQTEAYFSKLKLPASEQIEVLFFPSTALLERAKNAALKANPKIQIGAQNTHWELKGAFTGEVSVTVLKELNIQWTLVGHSERRQLFGETDQTASKRALTALQSGLHVLYCVGETKAERESNQTNAVLKRQLEPLLKPEFKSYFGKTLALAYEPVWAIGTGLTATPKQAQDAHHEIRKRIPAPEHTRILYGGSVTPETTSELIAQPDIDGALVGGASNDPEKFSQILTNAATI